MHRWIVFSLGSLLLFSTNCSKNALSERDQQQNQRRNTAELKREELKQVVGRYTGTLKQSSGKIHNVSLTLLIKEVPTAADGQIDPITIPTLSGHLRFNYGVNAEYIPFALTEADFDPKRKIISFQSKNGQYGELKTTLTKSNQTLTGSWSITNQDAGTLDLYKTEDPDGTLSIPAVQLGGTYQGKLQSEDWGGPIQGLSLTLVVNQDLSQPAGIRINGSLQVYYGEFGSTEYEIFPIDYISYNLFTGKLVMEIGGELNSTLEGLVNGGTISTTLISKQYGKLGTADLKKG